MSKILEAQCAEGVVSVGPTIVPEATILGEGVGESEGLLFLDGELKQYLPKTSPDLKSTLESLIESLGNVVAALQAIDGAGYVISVTGATGIPSPPVAASDISAIESGIDDLTALKDALR
jgi:hypothetical protein